MKKVLIFNPYFDTLGGGERYTAGIIAAYIQAGYQVIVAWSDESLSDQLVRRFNMSLDFTVDAQGYAILTNGSLMQRLHYQRRFQSIFWVSDGSLPFLVAKKNIVHFQVPFTSYQLHPLDGVKRLLYSHVVCNSQFTQQIIDATYHLSSSVLYPPCPMINPKKKEHVILGVGRFSTTLHGKRQDILIKAFQQLNPAGWKLILAGGCLDSTLISSLQSLIKDSSIELVPNPSWADLENLYGSASLFWHAAGFEVDEYAHPEQVEHFGIATVEAMSAGTVPLVYDAGGQREVVADAETGYRWHTIEELVSRSNQLIQDSSLLNRLSTVAQQASTQFTTERFVHDYIQTIIS